MNDRKESCSVNRAKGPPLLITWATYSEKQDRETQQDALSDIPPTKSAGS